MMRRLAQHACLFGAMVAIVIAARPLNAQSFGDLQTPAKPLVLRAVGSFFVGGRTVNASSTETGLYRGGPLTVDQMYVQYMIPLRARRRPVVMIHGATLSGKSFETTPDGRMGWYEYFVRKGFASYVVDQVGRARSGFDQRAFNNVRAGIAPPTSQPNLRRVANDVAMLRFRVGSMPGEAFSDTQFPAPAAGEFAKQTVPDLSQSLPPEDPNYAALSDLAKDLKGAILLGHSQGGLYPFETALLDPQGISALIAIEPPGCKAASYSDTQIGELAKFPILVVFGDHIENPQSVGPQWSDAYKDCKAFIERVNRHGGRAKLLRPADLGITGNSHMLMEDRNNLRIADLIITWIDQQKL